MCSVTSAPFFLGYYIAHSQIIQIQRFSHKKLQLFPNNICISFLQSTLTFLLSSPTRKNNNNMKLTYLCLLAVIVASAVAAPL